MKNSIVIGFFNILVHRSFFGKTTSFAGRFLSIRCKIELLLVIFIIVILSACSNPVQSSTPIMVFLPTSETIWKDGSEFLVHWTGGSTDSVLGEFSLANGLKWSFGEDYQIQVNDFTSESGISNEFSIWAIDIVEPNSSTVWEWEQTDTEVEWIPGSGSIVRIEIWKNGFKVDNYCDWTVNDGSYTRSAAISEDWGNGIGYQIKLIDDLGNVGVSAELSISPDLLPEGMEFVSIPQGSFQMGAPSGEQGSFSDERPVHMVTFAYDFEMMTTEVTQRIWIEVMGTNPSHFTGDLNRPVERVPWDDCQNFIDAMNALDPSHIYRLPSESEWEYCCRAGTNTRFYWGEDSSETVINGYAWWNGNSGATTYPVAEKLPNAWGLYDMSGNVWEWCDDRWHNNYTGAPTDGSAWISGVYNYRVKRSGCFNASASWCRSASRWYSSPSAGYNEVGFRLVRIER